MIYFTSDLHFFNQNILRHCDRPFASKEEGIRRYDVGVDANGFAPVSIYEIMRFYADDPAIRHGRRTE